MKTFTYLAINTLMLLSSCGVGDLENQVALLSSSQSLLNSEKDSLVKLLSLKSDTLKARNLAYATLTSDKTELEVRAKALQALLNTRTKQLSNAQASGSKMESDIASEAAKNDSLLRELSILNRKIAEIDSRISQEQKEYIALNESLKKESEKRKADSVAFANAPKPAVVRTGFVHTGEIGAGIGLGDTGPDYSARFISLYYILSYRFNNYFLAGAGTGVNFYNGGAMIPLFADLRYYFRGRQFVPFLAGDGGVLFSLDKLSESGIFINSQLGISRVLNDKMKLNLSAGFYVQQAPAGVRNSFVNFKGGFSFGK